MNFRISIGAAALIALSLPAVAADDIETVVGRPGGVVSSTPITRGDSVVAAPAASAPAPGRIDDLVAGRVQAPRQEPAAAPANEDLRWLMASSQHPWPLRYRELTTPAVLYVPLPDAQSLRLMLPGMTLEEARRARQAVAKYITDLIGAAAQDRARQLDAFTSWSEQTLKQKATLTANNDWQQYTFWKLVHESVDAYRAEVAPQSEMLLRNMANNVPNFVATVTELMNAAQGYEQRTAWYQVLVQLKEGLQLYQLQMQEGDAQILRAVDSFAGGNPTVPRPEGDVPVRDPVTGERAMPKVEKPSVELSALPGPKPASAPAAELPAQGNPVVAYFLVAAVLAAVAAGFLKLRRRKVPAPPAT